MRDGAFCHGLVLDVVLTRRPKVCKMDEIIFVLKIEPRYYIFTLYWVISRSYFNKSRGKMTSSGPTHTLLRTITTMIRAKCAHHIFTTVQTY